MKKEYLKWHSPHLDKDMELMIYGHAGAKVLVFPTRDGNFLEYERLRMTDQLADKIEAGHLQIYTIDYQAGETFTAGGQNPKDGLTATSSTSNTCSTKSSHSWTTATRTSA